LLVGICAPFLFKEVILPKSNSSPVEIVETCGIAREKGWLYYIDAQGDICRVQNAGANRVTEKVKDLKIKKESGWLYFINNQGNIGRSRLTVGRKAKIGTIKNKGIKFKKYNSISESGFKKKVVSIVANTMEIPRWVVAKAMKSVDWEKLLRFQQSYWK
jgi:hypothetical protein